MALKLLVLLLSIFISSTCLATFSGDPADDVNCQGAWLMDFDEDPIRDDSQNSNTGALLGAGEPDFTTAGTPAAYSVGYYDFDGSDDVITVSDSASLDTGGTNFSFGGWAKFDTLPSGLDGTSQHFFAIKDNDFGFFMARTGDFPDWARIMKWTVWSDSAGFWYNSGLTVISTGIWYHVYGTHANGPLEIFIDGVSDDTGDRFGTFVPSADDLLFGKTAEANTNEVRLDEWSFFDDILDSTEINDIMDNGLKPVAAGAPQVMIIHIQ